VLIEVRVERAVEGIGRAAEEVLDEVEGLLGRVAGAVAARARDYAPVRTGRLRGSIESRRAGRLKYVVRASAPYAGYVVEASVPTSYITVVEAFGAGRADIAAVNAFSYLLAHERYGARAVLRVVRRGGELSYRGQIIAHVASGITTLRQLHGRRIAYVDPASTSGYILPKALLEREGIRPAEEVFAMRHDNVVTMVYQRQVDAGATYYSPPDPHTGEIRDARARVLHQFPDVLERVRIVALTDSIPNDPIIVRADLPEPVLERLIQALLEFAATPQGKRALYEIYSVEGFAPVHDRDYDGLRRLLRQYVGDVERLLRQ
jgi:phosphonate transport system substrate-binding protein